MTIKLIDAQQINGQEWAAGSVLDLGPDLAQAIITRGKATLVEEFHRTAVAEEIETPERTVRRRTTPKKAEQE